MKDGKLRVALVGTSFGAEFLPIYLHHYEGYSTQEVAEILKIPRGTVCIRLKRGRELLKNALTEVE